MSSWIGMVLMAQANADFADIRDPASIMDWRIWAGVAVLLLVCLVGFMVYRRYRRRQIEKAAMGPPPLPPGEWARRELDRLAGAEKSLSDERFTVEVSQVLRTYIEMAFQLPAPEQTTEEFLNAIADHPVFSGGTGARMEAFLQQCDLIKFARQAISSHQRSELLANARDFVETADRQNPENLKQPGPVSGLETK